MGRAAVHPAGMLSQDAATSRRSKPPGTWPPPAQKPTLRAGGGALWRPPLVTRHSTEGGPRTRRGLFQPGGRLAEPGPQPGPDGSSPSPPGSAGQGRGRLQIQKCLGATAAQGSDTPRWATSWVTTVAPSGRAAGAHPGPATEAPRPRPRRARGRPGHLHQLEDVVRLPVLGHFRGDVVRRGGRVHAAGQRGRSLGTAVAKGVTSSAGAAPWRPPSPGARGLTSLARAAGPGLALLLLRVSAGTSGRLPLRPSRARGAPGGPPLCWDPGQHLEGKSGPCFWFRLRSLARAGGPLASVSPPLK